MHDVSVEPLHGARVAAGLAVTVGVTDTFEVAVMLGVGVATTRHASLGCVLHRVLTMPPSALKHPAGEVAVQQPWATAQTLHALTCAPLQGGSDGVGVAQAPAAMPKTLHSTGSVGVTVGTVIVSGMRPVGVGDAAGVGELPRPELSEPHPASATSSTMTKAAPAERVAFAPALPTAASSRRIFTNDMTRERARLMPRTACAFGDAWRSRSVAPRAINASPRTSVCGDCRYARCARMPAADDGHHHQLGVHLEPDLALN